MPRPSELKSFENTAEWFAIASDKGLVNILAFSDDQIFFDNNLKSAAEKLNPAKIQRIHLFGKAAELRISRTATGFDELWLDDDGWSQDDVEDENYLVWNTEEQGLDYIRPINADKLMIRHYIRYDDQGQAYFSHSRLVETA